MKQDKIKLEDQDLSFLTEGTEEFELYMADLYWAQSFCFRKSGRNDGSILRYS